MRKMKILRTGGECRASSRNRQEQKPMTKSRFCFGGGLLGSFHKGLLTRQQCTSFFFMCEGNQLLHIWMLQLCSAARCQEFQKIVKSPDFPTGVQKLVRFFSFSPLSCLVLGAGYLGNLIPILFLLSLL